MEKKRSAIRKILLNTATFNKVELTPTFVNLFFGRNGVGKTTIAGAIRDNDELLWMEGSDKDTYDILVYDQSFINNNFASYSGLPGVFTVDQVNIKIRHKIDELTNEKRKTDIYASNLIDAGNKKKAEKEKLLSGLQDRLWKKSAEIRTDFDAAMAGSKRKSAFAEKILNTAPANHDIVKLKDLYDVAYDKGAKLYNPFRDSSNAYGRYDLSGEVLMGRPIVSSSETPFAQFMKSLMATDWVKNGHAHFVKNSNGKCPFCQQSLPDDFEQNIKSCFDEQYQNDQNALAEFQMAYKNWIQNVLVIYESNLSGAYERLDLSLYREKLERLKTIAKANLQLIEKKLEKPALVVEPEDIKPLIADIDALIRDFNDKISENNEVVNSGKSKKTECAAAVWEHLAFTFLDDIKEYNDSLLEVTKVLKEMGDVYREKKQYSAKIQSEIDSLRNKTINTGGAIDGINKMLKESGFQGFYIRETMDIPDTYEVVRENGQVAEALSEGEKSFIAFLYFYHLVRGSGQAKAKTTAPGAGRIKNLQDEADSREKIVVIDDPVSGLDGNTLFVVSSLVRKMTETCIRCADDSRQSGAWSNIRQIFILTHNNGFYREISYNLEAGSDSASFFTIRKSKNISSVEECANEEEAAKEPGPGQN